MNIIRFISVLFLIGPAVTHAEGCNLLIGASDYAPLTYNDSKNNIIGLDVELVKLIAKKANCKVTWEPILPWERVISGIKEGTLTMTTSAAITPERQVFAEFVAYRPDSTKVFVRKEDLSKIQNINSLEDLITKTNFTVGIYIGYHYGSSFEKLSVDPRYKDRFIAIPDSAMSANFMKLQACRIDAVLLETVVGMDLIKTGKLDDKKQVLAFELDDPGPDSFANIMISKIANSKGNYLNLLKEAVKEIQESEEYKQILKRYYTNN